MTLQEAIAEVKRGALRLWGGYILPSPEADAIRTQILNAAASGDLIPKADAEQAVAVAYELTVKEVECWLDEAEWPETRRGLTMAILALAPADALAEVERLRGLLDHGLKECARETVRAEAAAAEVARLREALTSIECGRSPAPPWGAAG